MWPIGGIFAYSGGAPVNVDAHQRRAGARGRREHRRRRRWCATSRTSRRATRRTTSTGSARRCSPRRRPDAAAARCSSTCADGAPAGRRRRVIDVPRRLHERATTRPGRGTPPPARGALARSTACRQTVGRRRADRAARTWSSSSRTYTRRRPRRRAPSARATCGSSPTAGHAHRPLGAPRQGPAGQVRRRRRQPDPAAARPHLGRAAPDGQRGRRRPRRRVPATTLPPATTAPPTTATRSRERSEPPVRDGR